MKLEQVIEKIKADQVKPNSTPQTSGQMRDRANRLRDMATTLKIQGIEVRNEYR